MNKNSLIRCSMLAFGVAVVTVAAVASVATAARPIRPPCGPQYCLDVWNPVTCSNGVTYSNACYAARACATGCGPANW
jgi:hypothetical protein